MTSRVVVVLFVAGLVSFGASARVALTASNSVSASSIGYELRAQGVNDLKPADCHGALVSLVAGDTLIAGTGSAELILGSAGIDTITGGAGADCIVGGGGADIINGGADDDDIYGGPGLDACTGGLGTDTFPGGDCEVPVQ